MNTANLDKIKDIPYALTDFYSLLEEVRYRVFFNFIR